MDRRFFVEHQALRVPVDMDIDDVVLVEEKVRENGILDFQRRQRLLLSKLEKHSQDRVVSLAVQPFAFDLDPKTIGERYSQNISLIVALPVQFLTFLFTPVVWLVERVTAPFTRSKKIPTTNEAEIRFLTRIGFQEGVIENDEAEMIQRVFQLNDLTAADLMSPRVTITYLRGDLTLAEAKEEIIASQHSRILVIEDSIDRAIGLVLKHELLTAMIDDQSDQKISTLARPVRFVPETVKADKLLKTFQEIREHLAVVLDEYGGVSGVVTLEDVLEVLTGEIVDETDKIIDLQEIARQKRKRLLESGGVEFKS